MDPDSGLLVAGNLAVRASLSSLGDVIIARQEQFNFRLSMGLITCGCFFFLVGWQIAIGWFAVYASLQFIEAGLFRKRQPIGPLSRADEFAALAVMGTINAVYGGGSLLIAHSWGGWGAACSAYMLAGASLNSVLMSTGSKHAVQASLLPYFVCALLLPVVEFWLPTRPPMIILLVVALGGAQMMFAALRLWHATAAAKAAEQAAVARDLAAREANEKRLYQMAHHDALTGLSNRVVLHDALTALVTARQPGALLLIDLDGFKYVNDTLGHTAGDEVLRQVAVRIAASARAGDTTTRLGGDEFALLLENVTELAVAGDIAGRIIALVSQPIVIESQLISVGASIGIVLHPLHGVEAEQLFSNADLALYQAKAEGRHCFRVFKPSLRTLAYGKISQDTELRQAVDNGEFELFYQPQIRLRDGAVAGAEALLRWRHPRRGLIAPAIFLRALEHGPLAAHIGECVIQEACQQAASWRRDGYPDFKIAVNVFAAQFRSKTIINEIIRAGALADLPLHALEVEITENVILSRADEIIGTLKKLRALGVGVAFDDYGTGYASLSLLKRYPISRLKIDQSFIRSICESPSDATIVRAVISMADAFNLEVIAEGVQSQDQVDLLVRDGCAEGQGFFFSKPMSAGDFTGWLENRCETRPAVSQTAESPGTPRWP